MNPGTKDESNITTSPSPGGEFTCFTFDKSIDKNKFIAP
jgi:hypothetical protein